MARQKRALTNVGGAVIRSGDRRASATLARAMTVVPGEGLERWTHGFHSYAARMHPDTAARLVRGLSRPGEVVLDPFCGSGTVLVEALAAGRRALGRDLGVLAVRLARLRCAVTSETQRRALRDEAGRIAHLAAAHAARGAPPQGPGEGEGTEYDDDDDGRFDTTARLELEWLRALLAGERDPFAREALELVLSAILIKVSSQESDTDQRLRPRGRPLPRGAVAGLFRDKARELSLRLKELSKAARAAADGDSDLRPEIAVDDARSLATVADGAVDAVITSPPYPNVYDYVDHHAARARWLGLDESALRAGEIGARRSFGAVDEGLERWERDGRAWVGAVARVLRPGGRAAVLGGDGATRRGPLRFDDCLGRWAARAGLDVVAAVAQKRPVWNPEARRAYENAPRARPPREHVVLLGRPGE